mmetsp:Transcript_15755/g.19207  ORF Transcript_15755/g.19207 Transcript_15755/m.19207 type:complete len:90 (-) Transcript_15755:76-345(-)
MYRKSFQLGRQRYNSAHAFYQCFAFKARSAVDPIATPTPMAMPAERQPFPDLNSPNPNTAPTRPPAATLSIPDSIVSSIPSGSFQLIIG